MTKQETKQSLSNVRTAFQLDRWEGNLVNLHKDELKPSVRSYADNLSNQILNSFKQNGIRSVSEMEKLASPKTPLSELKRINDLMEKLSNVLKTGEIPVNTEDPEEALLKKDLNPILDEWIEKYNTREVRSGPMGTRARFLEEKINTLPIVSYETLIKDRYFLQRILEYIHSILPPDKNWDCGFFVSLIYINSFKDAPGDYYKAKEIFKKVYQEFDLTNLSPVGYLGFSHPGGKITIKGIAGMDTGCGISDGIIKLEKAEMGAGSQMSGGLIIAENIGDYGGRDMYGGEIRVDNAGSGVGNNMQGGLIKVDKAGDNLGYCMLGGTIIARQAGNCAGNNMYGGEIQIEEAGDNLGFNMMKGKIYVKKTGRYVGKSMGTIGSNMGGNIYIEEACQSFGKRWGGRIFIKGKETRRGLKKN